MIVTTARIPWGFRGWNQETKGETASLSVRNQWRRKRKRSRRSWSVDLQKRTLKAMVRPRMEVGPIEKGSTLASLLISIGDDVGVSVCLTVKTIKTETLSIRETEFLESETKSAFFFFVSSNSESIRSCNQGKEIDFITKV